LVKKTPGTNIYHKKCGKKVLTVRERTEGQSQKLTPRHEMRRSERIRDKTRNRDPGLSSKNLPGDGKRMRKKFKMERGLGPGVLMRPSCA